MSSEADEVTMQGDGTKKKEAVTQQEEITPDEAIAQEEITQNKAITTSKIDAADPPPSEPPAKKPRNACKPPPPARARPLDSSADGICGASEVTELMSRRPPAAQSSASPPLSFPLGPSGTAGSTSGALLSAAAPVARLVGGRHALGAYLAPGAPLPPSVLVYTTPSFVAIRDRYPKASVHTLLLPRSARHNLRAPMDVLNDPVEADFLAELRREAERLRNVVGSELQRRFGAVSRQDRARERALNGEEEAEGGAAAEGEGDGKAGGEAMTLPAGRDWAREVRVGVHARPSMAHLHVHVLSPDMVSAALRHRKHYNSFATAFLVDLADFPLGAGDARRDRGGQDALLGGEMRCWRCGRAGWEGRGGWDRLKRHLEAELDEWKRE